MLPFFLTFFVGGRPISLKEFFPAMAMKYMYHIVDDLINDRENVGVNVFQYAWYNNGINKISLLSECLLQCKPSIFRQRIVMPNNLPLYKFNTVS